MANRQTESKRQYGYIYRSPAMSAEPLRSLLNKEKHTFTHGWAWTYSDMYTLARVSDPLVGDQGRASNDKFEIRWRKKGDVYDVLILTVYLHTLNHMLNTVFGANPWPSFKSLRPAGNDHDDQAWQILPNQDYMLPQPIGFNDKKIKSTYFIAPNGSTQFVALIGSHK